MNGADRLGAMSFASHRWSGWGDTKVCEDCGAVWSERRKRWKVKLGYTWTKPPVIACRISRPGLTPPQPGP